MGARSKELDAQIERLRAKADKATSDTKAQYHRELLSLDTKRETARLWLQASATTGEEAWKHLKTPVDRALSDLGSAVGRVAYGFE